jgi:hypothetical protein
LTLKDLATGEQRRVPRAGIEEALAAALAAAGGPGR